MQLFVSGAEVCAAYIAGMSQATWWLSTQETRRLREALTDELDEGR